MEGSRPQVTLVFMGSAEKHTSVEKRFDVQLSGCGGVKKEGEQSGAGCRSNHLRRFGFTVNYSLTYRQNDNILTLDPNVVQPCTPKSSSFSATFGPHSPSLEARSLRICHVPFPLATKVSQVGQTGKLYHVSLHYSERLLLSGRVHLGRSLREL